MAQMDEFKKEREAIKTAPLKKRLEYFWDYYKWHTIITIVVISIICGYVHHVVTAKESTLYGVLLNSFSEEDAISTIVDEFASQEEIDLSRYDIILNTSLSYGNAFTSTESQQVIIAQSSAGMIDFFTGDLESMQDLAYSFMLQDLREVLTEAQIEAYEPYFLYVDQAVLDDINEAANNLDDTVSISYPDCHDPATMEDPIPVLIDMSRCDKLTFAYADVLTEIAFGVSASAPHTEKTLAFLDYLIA